MTDAVVLSESLLLLGDAVPLDEPVVRYGELVLSLAKKEGKANTLLADHLFSPSLLLAERIERGLIPLANRSVLELGAGCALPSLLAAMLPAPQTPALVVATDHPSTEILSNLQENIKRNAGLAQCAVVATGYEWGGDAREVLRHKPGGFEVILMSDLMHFSGEHGKLAQSVEVLLARDKNARVYAAAGKYTSWKTCMAFMKEMEERGIVCCGGGEDKEWKGERTVEGMSKEEMGERKGNCWWWEMRIDALISDN